MSILNCVAPANLSELPQGLTEVFLDNIQDNLNIIEKYPLHSDFSANASSKMQADKEWSQVFDLGDCALIW